jgi:putative restriction endonuclease
MGGRDPGRLRATTLGMTVIGNLRDDQIRTAMFGHLDGLMAQSNDGLLASTAINTFVFEGRPIKLVVQSGIWKPAGLDAALTIRTTFTPPNVTPPYEDDVSDDGFIHYKYRGTDPHHSDNRALRETMVRQLRLAYFIGVARGVYLARYPVWLRNEDPERHEFAVAVDPAQLLIDLSSLSAPQRAYAERLTRSRLHQPLFRARVLHAYGERCSMCRLHHVELLDAAHIIPDGQPRGDPVVPNGLSLCKIHHAAYDANLLGVRPDLTVDVAPRIRGEIDGPMLLHGLQDMQGARLTVPRTRAAQPDPERLDSRYAQFRAAS